MPYFFIPRLRRQTGVTKYAQADGQDSGKEDGENASQLLQFAGSSHNTRIHTSSVGPPRTKGVVKTHELEVYVVVSSSLVQTTTFLAMGSDRRHILVSDRTQPCER